MGEVTFNEFNDLFHQYHPNDFSLVCNNNVLYYGGETREIFGGVRINYGDNFNLQNYRVRNINPNVWKLPPFLLFFNIRESVVRSEDNIVNSNNEIYNFRKIINKTNLSDQERLFINYEVDYFLALDKISQTLTGGLVDYYNQLNNIIRNQILHTPYSSATEGIRLIQDKIQNIAIQNINQENNIISTLNNNIETNPDGGRGYQRVNRKSGVHYSEEMFGSSNDSFIKDSAAYINAVILILITLSAVIVALTIIFNI